MKKEKLIDIVKEKFSLSDKTARGFILSGRVLINEKVVTKMGEKFDKDENIRIKKEIEYVSRGAYKLLTAFEENSLDVTDKICIDIGSSTGGFTQVLLEKGARKVYATDVGKNLLDYALQRDPRVVQIEDKKITDLKKEDIGDEGIDLAVMDVSFTSSIHIIKYVYEEFKLKEMITLIKPQFEYRRLKELLRLSDTFSGVVNDENERNKIIEYIKTEIEDYGIEIISITKSKMKGAKGNIEYLFYTKK